MKGSDYVRCREHLHLCTKWSILIRVLAPCLHLYYPTLLQLITLTLTVDEEMARDILFFPRERDMRHYVAVLDKMSKGICEEEEGKGKATTDRIKHVQILFLNMLVLWHSRQWVLARAFMVHGGLFSLIQLLRTSVDAQVRWNGVQVLARLLIEHPDGWEFDWCVHVVGVKEHAREILSHQFLIRRTDRAVSIRIRISFLSWHFSKAPSHMPHLTFLSMTPTQDGSIGFSHAPRPSASQIAVFFCTTNTVCVFTGFFGRGL